MSAERELFVERARAVTIADAAPGLGLAFTGKRDEHPQPCPNCGGEDCFSFNTKTEKWNCRAAGYGGSDAIGMAAHVLELDTRKFDQFLEACAAVLGEPVPGEAPESPAEKRAREKRLAEKRAENVRKAAARSADAADFREREQGRARGIFNHASRRWQKTPVATYLYRRLAIDAPLPSTLHIRASHETYWHGKDEFGRPADHHTGPAMVAAFEDADRRIIGCHITWIDLANPAGKWRPDLGLDSKGKALPTKKMRGSKKRGVIPVAGGRGAFRWIIGEGIETVVAVAVAEDFRSDTFYGAAGDIGNLTGPAASKGGFSHPDLKKADKNGRERAVRIRSPWPDEDKLEDAFPVDEHARECILLGERDSEAYATAAALTRGRLRIEKLRPHCKVSIAWPPMGYGDFCDVLAGEASGHG